MTVSIEDIRRAADLIKGQINPTPCVSSQTLSEITGATVYLKCENLHFTASFKERGALVKLLSLTSEQKQRGIIAMSAGDHAQSIVLHARRLGIRSVIVMPRFTPSIKVEHTQALGAEVILHGETLDETISFTQRLADQRGLELIHPFDDEKVIAGQGTAAMEMIEICPDLDVILVPVGGGGLISGTAIAAKGMRPSIEVIGVEAERFPSMSRALGGTMLECGTTTIAEGIAVKSPGKLTLPIVQKYVRDILLVDESDIENAVLLLLEVEKTVVEGAGASGLAALIKNRDRFSGKKVGLILSGGNIDLLILSSIIQRGLVRSGRIARMRVETRDVPGALAGVAHRIAEAKANIVEVHHQRAFTNRPVQVAEIDFVLQTRGADHVQEIIESLIAAGYQATWMDDDPIRLTR